MRATCSIFLLVLVGLSFRVAAAGASGWEADRFEPKPRYDVVVVEGSMHHLRKNEAPEWAEFGTTRPDSVLVSTFHAVATSSPVALELTQYDVRREWVIYINGEEIGSLERDERLMKVYRSVPGGVLVDGPNELAIRQLGDEADDIEVGRIRLHDRAIRDVLGDARVSVQVSEADASRALPARITVVDRRGALQTLGGPVEEAPSAHTAVRPGTIYFGENGASFSLPAGAYTIYATRGFEYSVDSVEVDLNSGAEMETHLSLRRDVPTEGWVAMDTHVHTVTHSGHGDATVEERVLTLAGEGIELPVLTDHNTAVDLRPVAERMGYDAYFTPIVGNEYTTPAGHFNLFPVEETGPVPDPDVTTWGEVADRLEAVGEPQIVVLNHARDEHGGFRPFGPLNYLPSAGMPRQGPRVPANAMEVINSSAQQHDITRLVHDWLGATNAGASVTPVGSSDSHDVARYLVGQGRTYVRINDDNPGRLSVDDAIQSLRQGAVVASFGLLPMIQVNGSYGPGDIVPAEGEVHVAVRVLAPKWLDVSDVTLYMNGVEVRTENGVDGGRTGEKGEIQWTVPLPNHDVFFSVVALGPGDTPVFWPIPKPYQRESTAWNPRLIGVTGAVWIDVDGDGRATSARAYAGRLVEAADGDRDRLLTSLADFDEAVAVQAAAVLYHAGDLTEAFEAEGHLTGAAPHVQSGFRTFLSELKSQR